MAGKILFAADLAKILGWNTRRANRWMQSTGSGSKRGSRWITSAEILRKYFPEAYREVVLSMDDEDP